MVHLGQNIKLIRETAKKTQVEFARIFDLKDRNGDYSKDKVWTYENGKANPSEPLIISISTYAGVSVHDIKNKKLKASDLTITPEVPQHTGNSITADLIESYRDQILMQKGRIKFLEDQFSLATEKIQHLLFLILSRSETSQYDIADLLVKQKIIQADEVEDKLSIENLENYERLKKEVGIVSPLGK